MGQAQSTSLAVNDVINKSATNVLMQNSQKCAQENTTTNTLIFNDIHALGNCNLKISGVTQTSVQTPNFTCSQSNTTSSDLQIAFKNALEQQAESTAKSGLVGSSSTDSATISSTINDVSTNVDMSSVSSCVQNNMQTQTQIYEDLTAGCPAICEQIVDITKMTPDQIHAYEDLCTMNLSNITQSAVQGAVANCLQNNTAVQKAVETISNDTKQTATATSTNFGGDTSMWYILLLICCILCCISLSASSIFFTS